MNLTPKQIGLVKGNFERLAPMSDAATCMFYDRLFELDPSLRWVFGSDTLDQRRKLMQMLSMAVYSLDNIEAIVPIVLALGQRQAKYKLLHGQYALVEKALLWTLAITLGDAFTPESFQAWAAAFDLVMQTILAGSDVRKAA